MYKWLIYAWKNAASLNIRDFQFKTTSTFYHTLIRIATIEKRKKKNEGLVKINGERNIYIPLVEMQIHLSFMGVHKFLKDLGLLRDLDTSLLSLCPQKPKPVYDKPAQLMVI